MLDVSSSSITTPRNLVHLTLLSFLPLSSILREGSYGDKAGVC